MRLKIVLVLLLHLASTAASAETLLVVGDSLSAGYGLPQGRDWVTLLQQRLTADGRDVQIINASISGETSAGGKRRIQSLLDRHQPAVTIIELGANDGLRGIYPDLIRANLAFMVKASQQAGAKAMLIGMRIPPNYGREYGEEFHALFNKVAREYGASLVPFMLDGFADDQAMFQDDGIHPSTQAQPMIMENIYRQLKPLLD